MSERNLVIRKSSLPGAGKGLFTKTPIAKGSIVIEYLGRITTWKEVQSHESFNGYVFYINRNHVVDAKADKKALARYANDAKGLARVPGLRNNAAYITRQKKVFIKAIHDIPAGGEILVGYGKEYWDAIRYNKKLESKKPESKKKKV